MRGGARRRPRSRAAWGARERVVEWGNEKNAAIGRRCATQCVEDNASAETKGEAAEGTRKPDRTAAGREGEGVRAGVSGQRWA